MDQVMSLRNLMENKQLNFNQPLLSVRRFSSNANEKPKAESKIPPLPVYKSELKSGPVRNPGTVPFVWEKTPGKPKDESKTKSQFPVPVPKLPPGRASDSKQEVLVSVNASSDETSRDSEVEKMNYRSENDEEEDEVFRDAIDRFSRTESFFMNCSITGVSGFEGSEIESSLGAFSTDPRARDFMMDRFLPAAKAMASETPPHPIRKQSAVLERSRETKMATNGNRQNRLVQRQYVQETTRNEESEDEDEDDDDYYYDRSEYSSLRGCGFLPRFCFKGSFDLLNSVPGLKMQAPPASSVRRRRNSSTENEPSQAVHTKEKAHESETNRRSVSSFQELLVDESSSGSPVIEKTLYIDSVHKIKSPDSSSSSLNVKGVRTYSGEIIDDAYVNSAETKELHLLHSATRDMKNSNVADEKTILRPGSMESMGSCSPNSSGRSICEVKTILNSSRFNQERNQEAKELSGSRIANEKKFDLESQFPLKPSNRRNSDELTGNTIREASSEETDSEKTDLEMKQPEKSEVPQESFYGCAQDSLDIRTTKIAANRKIDSENQNLKRVSDEENSNGRRFQMQFAPPPPKSPSESWLQRTLPTSSRNSSTSRSSIAMRINAISTATSPNLQWQSTVERSTTNHQHLQFSEELLPSISEV